MQPTRSNSSTLTYHLPKTFRLDNPNLVCLKTWFLILIEKQVPLINFIERRDVCCIYNSRFIQLTSLIDFNDFYITVSMLNNNITLINIVIERNFDFLLPLNKISSNDTSHLFTCINLYFKLIIFNDFKQWIIIYFVK